MAARNVLVAQSGGPSPLINASLRGIIEGCRASRAFGKLYAAANGVEGLLREELLDLSAALAREVELLSATPAAGVIGTCRYKLRSANQQDFERVIAVLQAHEVGYLFYIGGNDSMDTANKIADLAHQRGPDLVAVGVPKTIDNDLGDQAFQLLDHSPGYGSCARYWALTVQQADQENRGSFPADPVLVLQAMGRRIGFIPAAARLADPQRELPMLLLLPESSYTLPELADLINDTLRRAGRAIVVLSEGLDLGSLGERQDAFGHTQFSSSASTAAQLLVNYLNQAGLAARGSARANIPGTQQRHDIVYASTVDLAEARAVGQQAAGLAAQHISGKMASLVRTSDAPYTVRYTSVPLGEMANSERTFPKEWIDRDHCDVTDDFIRYAQPLLGDGWPEVILEHGRLRFAELGAQQVRQVLEVYTPQDYRK